ncbi:MAG TPA: hypothetical protein VK742_01840 [Candidatus Sulfotelmatobacter sp.]|nr:hypothetical protein [Candidatus Sulfotelmatobacter sp.]
MKQIGLTIGEWIKQICALPATVAKAFGQHKQQAARAELEAERLDRIRNPEKYRGK